MLSTVMTMAATAAMTAGPCGSDYSKSSCGSNSQATITQVAHTNSSNTIVDVASNAGQFNTLLAAAKAAGLADALSTGHFTVFAPTDEAFAALGQDAINDLLRPENRGLLQSILKYHVVEGSVDSHRVADAGGLATLNGQRAEIEQRRGGLSIAGAHIVKADIKASNGIIHVIDRVIMPSTKDLVETAVEAGSFSTLAAAVQAAGLVATLQSDGPFTVLAPTDEAFAALPAGTVESLLKPENRDQLKAVLLYHVVPGRVYASDVVKLRNAKTAQGGEIAIGAAGGRVFINGAQVVQTDIDATNGVIHVIDSVLLPN